MAKRKDQRRKGPSSRRWHREPDPLPEPIPPPITQSRSQHQPTKASRDTVTLMVLAGYLRDDIAAYLAIEGATLIHHYREELDKADMRGVAQIVGKLFEAAGRGEAWAIQYFLRCKGRKLGWSDRGDSRPAGDIPYSGVYDLTKLSDQELEEFERLSRKAATSAAAAGDGGVSPGEDQTRH